jgi:DNA-directed RNA polymerase alpha subunit
VTAVHNPRLISVYDAIPDGTGISTRIANALWRDGIETLGDLTKRTEADLLDIPNLGPACLAVVKAALAEHGLSLKGAS